MTHVPERICEALNRRGRPCKNPAEPGSPFCRWHSMDEKGEQQTLSSDPRSKWSRFAKRPDEEQG